MLSNLLEGAGFICLSAAGYCWSIPAGLVATGLSLIALGFSLSSKAAKA